MWILKIGGGIAVRAQGADRRGDLRPRRSHQNRGRRHDRSDGFAPPPEPARKNSRSHPGGRNGALRFRRHRRVPRCRGRRRRRSFRTAASAFRVLTMQALADGIDGCGAAQVYEGRFRAPETHNGRWLEHQTGKIERGLATFEADAASVVRPARISASIAARLRARLSRSPLRRNMARDASAPRRLARRFRGARCRASRRRRRGKLSADRFIATNKKPGHTPGLSLSFR